MAAEKGLDARDLQEMIRAEFPLARHIGILVDQADDAAVVLSAPLAANANPAGTAFGGSLFSVAVLAGWAWVTRYLAAANVAADALIQESHIRYRTPVTGVLKATVLPPVHAHVVKFAKMLQRGNRGRIELRVTIGQGTLQAAEFDGVFVALVR